MNNSHLEMELKKNNETLKNINNKGKKILTKEELEKEINKLCDQNMDFEDKIENKNRQINIVDNNIKNLEKKIEDVDKDLKSKKQEKRVTNFIIKKINR